MSALPVFEQLLDRDPRWALSQGSQFFEGRGAVQEALFRITRRLNDLGIPYSVAGGMALFLHGYRRFTEDVDILVTREGLREIHSKLEGLGYLSPFPRSKNLRDTENGVRIEFLVTGDFPGDGKPKPLAFPDPAVASTTYQGIPFLTLPRLIELKLASGMSSPGRLRDLSDVMELIRLRNLPMSFAEQLNPYVQSKFRELWNQSRRRYIKVVSDQQIPQGTSTWDQLAEALPEMASLLDRMRADGVLLESDRAAPTGHAYLVTTDPEVAQAYDMHEESEYMQQGDHNHGELTE
jgi:hypothetical protein